LKKIIIFLILGILIFSGYYFIIEIDILGLKVEKVEIENLQDQNIEFLREKIYTDYGIISYNDKSIKISNYNGENSWSKELEDFINEIYFEENIFIVTGNKKKIIEIDLSGKIINEYVFEDEIIDFAKNSDIFVTLKDIEDNNKIVKIINGINEEIDIDGNIVCILPKDEIDSYTLGYFYFESGKINSVVEQRIINEDIKRWETKLDGELIADIKQTPSRNFVLTQKNFYTFNTDGIILWKYNNFDTVKEFHVDEINKNILILENRKLHILNFDSSVEKIIELDVEYDNIKLYKEYIFLSNTRTISVVEEEIYSIWPLEEKIINFHFIEDNIYIETDFNFYKGIIR